MKDRRSDSENKFPDGRDSEEIIDLLKSFYHADYGDIQDPDDFYAGIEHQLQEQDPVNKISKANREINNHYYSRQKKLEQIDNKLTQKRQELSKPKTKLLGYSQALILAFVIVGILAFFCN